MSCRRLFFSISNIFYDMEARVLYGKTLCIMQNTRKAAPHLGLNSKVACKLWQYVL